MSEEFVEWNPAWTVREEEKVRKAVRQLKRTIRFRRFRRKLYRMGLLKTFMFLGIVPHPRYIQHRQFRETKTLL